MAEHDNRNLEHLRTVVIATVVAFVQAENPACVEMGTEEEERVKMLAEIDHALYSIAQEALTAADTFRDAVS